MGMKLLVPKNFSSKSGCEVAGGTGTNRKLATGATSFYEQEFLSMTVYLQT